LAGVRFIDTIRCKLNYFSNNLSCKGDIVSDKKYSIEVDFEVYRELFSRRDSEEVTFNDVLRKLLGLPPNSRSIESSLPDSVPSSDIMGVKFPDGTILRRRYKNRTYTAEIFSGAIVFEGKRFDSPSGAAMEISKCNVNGWRFWECQIPGSDKWVLLDSYRKNRSS
jgi:hypothetical protein